jgi:K+-sensing histidine kinase KdpD
MIHLRIANQGETVPPDAAEEVFESYAQISDLDIGKPSGIEIYLATCRAFLRRMHGRIFLDAYEPEGTCFGFLLPTCSAFEEL